MKAGLLGLKTLKGAVRLKAPPPCASCQTGFCADLLPETREAVCRAKIWVNYARKHQQAFFLENRQVMLLESGCMVAIRTDEGAREQSVDLLGPGDVLGIVNVFNGQNQRDFFQILPLTECAGCMLPIRTMEELILAHPDLCRAFVAQFAGRFSRVVDNMMNKTLDTARDRLAYAEALLRARGVTKYSHEDLALLSGLNRITVTRLLGRRAEGNNREKTKEVGAPPHSSQ